MNRRTFLGSSVGLAAASPTFLLAGQGQEPDSTPRLFRTVTYNVYGYKGFPRNAENESRRKAASGQMAARLALELNLYKPDVITLQECPEEERVAELARHLGMMHVYFPGGFPGALLTTLPISRSENCPLPNGVEKGKLFSRHWGYAALDFHGLNIDVFSAHLHPSDQELRLQETRTALRVFAERTESNNALLFQGDLNHEPTGPEHALWMADGWSDTFADKGVGEGRTFHCVNLRKRIDYILTKGVLTDSLKRSRVLYEGQFRNNPDDPGSFALSDHLPVLSRFLLT